MQPHITRCFLTQSTAPLFPKTLLRRILCFRVPKFNYRRTDFYFLKQRKCVGEGAEPPQYFFFPPSTTSSQGSSTHVSPFSVCLYLIVPVLLSLCSAVTGAGEGPKSSHGSRRCVIHFFTCPHSPPASVSLLQTLSRSLYCNALTE